MKNLFAAACLAVVAIPLSAQSQQGVALFEQGRYDEARRALTPLVNDPEALFTLGRIALNLNDAEKAADYLERAVEKAPNKAEYHLFLADAYGTQARAANLFSQASLGSKAKTHLLRAVELDPNLIDARMGLIDFYIMAPGLMGGSHDKAVEQAVEIRKRDPFAGHRAFARIHTLDKKPDLARKEYLDLVREQPTSPRARYELGNFYLSVDKNYKAAATEYDAALKLDPGYMPATFQIGHLSVLTATNFVRGEEALKKYLAYTPKKDEPGLHRAWFWLGGIYEKQGKKSDAKRSYETSLKLRAGAKDVTEALKRVS